MSNVVYFPGTRAKLRKRTKRELELLFEENFQFYRFVLGYHADTATVSAGMQVEILRYTTQGEAESLYLLENHTYEPPPKAILQNVVARNEHG